MTRLNACLAAALIGMAVSAHAHGTAGHQAGPVAREQTGWGIAGDARTATRTVEVAMSDDMRFRPDRIEARQGETVRIVVKNGGALLHEFVMGDRKTLDAHAALMVKFPGMEHDEPYMAHVPPGAAQTIVWTFNRPGDFEFACLIAGHYQAGMVGTIKVRAATAPASMTEGEVRKIDPEHGKITLRHGPIGNLDMPAMTMAFQVRDRALLEKVRVGEKVLFAATNDGGRLTVTQLQPAR